MKHRWGAWLALAVGLLGTFCVWRTASDQADARLRVRFDRRVERIEYALTGRLHHCETDLWALRAFLGSSEVVEHDEWNLFSRRLLDLDIDDPDTGLGYAEWVDRERLERLAGELGKDRGPGLTILPREEREKYLILTRLTTIGECAADPGLDLGSIAEVGLAAGRAVAVDQMTPAIWQRDTDDSSEEAQLVLLLPTYSKDVSIDSAAQRVEHLEGFVVTFAPVADVTRGIAAEAGAVGIDFELYAGSDPECYVLFHDEDGVARGGSARHDEFLQIDEPLPVGSMVWRMHCAATPRFFSPDDHLLPNLVMGAGTVASLLLFAAVWTYIGAKRSARRAEEAGERWRESRAMLQLVIDSVPQLVAWKDPQGVFRGCNVSFARSVGLAATDDLVGRKDEDLPWRAPESGHLKECEARVMRSGAAEYHEIEPLHHADGSEGWVDTSRVPLHDTEGRVTGVLVSLEDITEKKRFDEMLKASEERLSLALEVTNDGLWDWDLSKNQVYFSPRYCAMLGYETGELSASYRGWADLLHPEDRPEAEKRITQAIESKDSTFEMEFRMRAKSGEWTWILSRGRVVASDAAGNPVRMLGTHADISERKHAEKEREQLVRLLRESNRSLAELNQQLERSNRELQDFAYVASHDLQEPLRKVQAFGDRLKSRYEENLDEQANDYLDRMQNAADRMKTLINGLLTFSRVTTKAQPFVKTDLSGVLKEVLSDLEVRIEELGARVEVSDLPSLDADPLQMRQLFQNLLSNALKFHRAGVAPVIRISAEVRSTQKHVKGVFAPELCEVVIEDNGIGFDPKYADRIFGVFQRLHGRGEFDGTGVGLAVCRKIVDRHNGRIIAEGRPGEGATFRMILPVHQAFQQEATT